MIARLLVAFVVVFLLTASAVAGTFTPKLTNIVALEGRLTPCFDNEVCAQFLMRGVSDYGTIGASHTFTKVNYVASISPNPGVSFDPGAGWVRFTKIPSSDVTITLQVIVQHEDGRVTRLTATVVMSGTGVAARQSEVKSAVPAMELQDEPSDEDDVELQEEPDDPS